MVQEPIPSTELPHMLQSFTETCLGGGFAVISGDYKAVERLEHDSRFTPAWRIQDRAFTLGRYQGRFDNIDVFMIHEEPGRVLVVCLAGLGLLERRIPEENVDGLRVKVAPINHAEAQRLASAQAQAAGGEVTEELLANYFAQITVFAGSRIDFVPSDHPVAFVFPIAE